MSTRSAESTTNPHLAAQLLDDLTEEIGEDERKTLEAGPPWGLFRALDFDFLSPRGQQFVQRIGWRLWANYQRLLDELFGGAANRPRPSLEQTRANVAAELRYLARQIEVACTQEPESRNRRRLVRVSRRDAARLERLAATLAAEEREAQP